MHLARISESPKMSPFIVCIFALLWPFSLGTTFSHATIGWSCRPIILHKNTGQTAFQSLPSAPQPRHRAAACLSPVAHGAWTAQKISQTQCLKWTLRLTWTFSCVHSRHFSQAAGILFCPLHRRRLGVFFFFFFQACALSCSSMSLFVNWPITAWMGRDI